MKEKKSAMTPIEAMYNQLTPENRQRVNQRIDALLRQQEQEAAAPGEGLGRPEAEKKGKGATA